MWAPAFLIALMSVSAAVSEAQIYNFKTYTVRNGLPSNIIDCLCQDSYGRLWIGTGDGLGVYDGEVFKNYGVADGLASGLVNCLLEDRFHPGVMWIGTNSGGVSRSESGVFHVIRLGKTDLGNRVNAIAEDDSGDVLCATDGGLFELKSDEPGPAPREILPNPCNQVMFARDTIYILKSTGQLLVLPAARLSETQSPDARTFSHVGRIYLDSKKEIWISSAKGDLFNIENGMEIRHLVRSVPSSFMDDSLGDTWVGTSEGLYRLDMIHSGKRSAVLLTRNNGLSSNSVTSVLVDREGDVWAGTYDNGLARLRDRNTCEFRLSYLYTATNSSQAASDWDGHIWVATLGGVDEIWSDGSGVPKIYMHAYRKIGVASGCAIAQIQSGDYLWLAAEDGIISSFRIDKTAEGRSSLVRLKSFSVNSVMPGTSVLSLYIDRQGRAWYSRDKAGVLEFDLRKGLSSARVYTTKNGLPDNSVRAICEDSRGNMWFGGYIGGLAELKNNGGRNPMKLFTTKDGLPGNSVRAIVEDDSGRIWIGTRYDGVAVLSKGKFRKFYVPQGMISDEIWSMAFDPKNGMFFGTESGLQKLTGYPMPGKSWEPVGDVTPVFSCGVTTSAPRSGSHRFLWACTGSGIILTDLSQMDRHDVPPLVYVTGLLVNGSEVAIGERMRFPYDMNTVTFHFAGVSLKDESNLIYRYTLEGADRGWTSVEGRLSVTYVSLKPGRYRFQVKAINSAGVESAGAAGISFVIVRPLWQRWWFILVSSLILISIGYATVRSRIRRLLEIERVRSRIATDLHDDIGAGLTRIAILADVALRQTEVLKPRSGDAAQSETDEVSEPLSPGSVVRKIGNHARELVDSMSDVVWSIDPKNLTVHDLITRFRGFANDTCEAKGIRLDIDIDEKLEKLRLDPGVMRTVLLIAKEALHNSVKHSGCKRVRVGIGARSRELWFAISDDGNGFVTESPRSGHGLENMRMRTEKLGGDFKLSSSVETGTIVEITVPLAS